MTRKDATPTDITSAAERLLSLKSADVADVGRAAPMRLTQLVVARFDMDVVEARVFLDCCGAVHVPTQQKADAEFHIQLQRVIDRYGLGYLFVDDAPGQNHHMIRPRGYDYAVDAVHPKEMETWRADYRNMRSVQQIMVASIIWLYRGGKDRVWLRRVPCTWPTTEALRTLHENAALSDWGLLLFLFPGW
jgi:hypothetical protein